VPLFSLLERLLVDSGTFSPNFGLACSQKTALFPGLCSFLDGPSPLLTGDPHPFRSFASSLEVTFFVVFLPDRFWTRILLQGDTRVVSQRFPSCILSFLPPPIWHSDLSYTVCVRPSPQAPPGTATLYEGSRHSDQPSNTLRPLRLQRGSLNPVA